jgi:hypothetical protein
MHLHSLFHANTLTNDNALRPGAKACHAEMMRQTKETKTKASKQTSFTMRDSDYI